MHPITKHHDGCACPRCDVIADTPAGYDERIAALTAKLAEKEAELSRVDEQEHTAWLRYDRRRDNPDVPVLVLCDSDAPGAFKVYRHGASAEVLKSTVTAAAMHTVKLEGKVAKLEAELEAARLALKKHRPFGPVAGCDHITTSCINCDRRDWV